ncbi:MAG TPA: hypothetical protein VJ921_02545, partial [Vicinamibacteria bacterium]|nr:hypothetical protein [Vicinamibacteria bacterium]
LILAYRLVLRQLVPGRALLAQLAAAALVFAILGSPLLLAQRRAAAEGRVEAEYPMRALRRWAPALVSFVTPTRYHPLYGPKLRFAGEYGDDSGIHPPGMRSETYLGLTALLLAFVGIPEALRRQSSFWIVAALTFLLLSLGPYLRLTGAWRTDFPLPYQLLYQLVPPLRASRDPTRFLPLLMISMTVLSALGLRSILEGCRKRARRTMVAVAIFALVLFEDLLPAPRMTSVVVDAQYEAIGRDPGDFAVIDLSFGKSAALAQTVHGRKITSGSLLVPRSAASDSSLGVEEDFKRPLPTLSLSEGPRLARLLELRAEIRRHRIGYVVYSGGSGPRLRLARLLGGEVTARPPLVFCRFEPAR